MSLRDWRGGELRLLAAALVIAVAAVSSVGFLADRVRAGLQRHAAEYLGGDAALESDRPIRPDWRVRAEALGLRGATSASFPSMAVSGRDPDATALVAVKAVSDGYPLKGAVVIEDDAGVRPAAGIPAPGTAWVDPEVLTALGLARGDSLALGRRTLQVAALIRSEPDRRMQVLGFGPRVLLNDADLEATGLVQPASRVGYRWAFAGDHAAVARLMAALKPELARGQHLESLEDGRPEMTRNLERAQRFLGLVALLTVLIAAVAVSSAARRYSARRVDTCALLRCFGLGQGQIAALFTLEFTLVGLLASCAGVLLGLALHGVLLRLLAGLVPGTAGAPGLLPGLQGLSCGLVLMLGFGLPPLEQLRRVPPLRVLRRDVGAPGPRVLLAYGAATAAVFLLLLWSAQDLKLGAIVGAGFLGCVALFALLAWAALLGLQALRRPGSALPVGLRYAIAAMRRRPLQTVAQAVALAVGLMALLVLALVRTDLVDQWRAQAPPGAPNRFLINIQPDQVEGVAARLRAGGVADAQLDPMVRGRLVQIDGRPVGPENYADERARGLVDREFNLSYREQAPAYNQVVAGRWFDPGAAELSIEEGIARRLGIALGQRLRFDVGGQLVEARVTSVRRLDWESMRVNFFVIMAPPLLRDAPQSFITSFHLGPRQGWIVGALVHEYPNVTVINIDQILVQVRALADQLVAAVQFLFLFALAAGVLVLYSALAATQDERLRESALLRALGASRRQLAMAQRAEMLILGALAGTLAAAGAIAIAWAVARYALEFDFHPPWWILPAGLAGGIAAALAGGWAGLRRVLTVPPLQSLREA